MVEFRELKVDELPSIMALQQIIVDHLEDPRVLQPLSEAEFINILSGNGIMIGAFEHTQLVGFRALLKPDINEDEHLGVDVGTTDLARVLYQEVSVVHPSMRGRGLQQKMGAYIMAQVDTSLYDWVCATVMPFNIASIKDKLSQRLFIRALKLKYGGKLRYVFGKDMRQSEDEHFTECQSLAMADTEGQQKLLNEGFIGTSIKLVGDEWFVQYEK